MSQLTAPHLMTPELLLVDDDAIQAATRNLILTRAGISVLVANTPRQALELLRSPELQRCLRLLVTDHLMPEMNGPELVGRVRGMLPQLPVMVVSGMPGAEAEYEGLQVAFQLKPFPPEELIRLAKSLINSPILRSA